MNLTHKGPSSLFLGTTISGVIPIENDFCHLLAHKSRGIMFSILFHPNFVLSYVTIKSNLYGELNLVNRC